MRFACAGCRACVLFRLLFLELFFFSSPFYLSNSWCHYFSFAQPHGCRNVCRKTILLCYPQAKKRLPSSDGITCMDVKSDFYLRSTSLHFKYVDDLRNFDDVTILKQFFYKILYALFVICKTKSNRVFTLVI